MSCCGQAAWTEDAFSLDDGAYILVYVGTSFVGVVFMFCSVVTVVVMVLRAGRTLHRQLLQVRLHALWARPPLLATNLMFVWLVGRGRAGSHAVTDGVLRRDADRPNLEPLQQGANAMGVLQCRAR